MASLRKTAPNGRRIRLLRQGLDELIKDSAFHYTYQCGLERLREEYGHQIAIVETPHKKPTCFAYALGLSGSEEYRRLLEDGKPAANPRFFEWLAGRQWIIEIAEASDGCLVAYYNQIGIQHVGLLRRDSKRVESKWGPNEIHAHPIWEMPASYGDIARYYSAPNSLDMLERFLDWRNLIQADTSE